MELQLNPELLKSFNNLETRNQQRRMDNETLEMTVKVLIGYYQNAIDKSGQYLWVNAIDELKLMSLCTELCDYYNFIDDFLGTDSKEYKIPVGALSCWITSRSADTYKLFSKLINEFKKTKSISKDSIKKYCSDHIGDRSDSDELLIEQLRFSTFHLIEMYRNGKIKACINGLFLLLKITNAAFPETKKYYVYDLLGFLNFWIGKSQQQINFENSRKYLRIAKENFTYASLTAQNNEKLNDFAKYQIQRIYFVSLSEARLRLIERSIPQALVLVEPLVDVIPDTDYFGKAYAQYVRGVCKRVLQGRLADDAIIDLKAALTIFLGTDKNPPFPRHAIKVIRELAISYVLMGKIEEAKDVISNMDNLINNEDDKNEINRFAKLRNSKKWKSLKTGLYSRISRKEFKIFWAKTKEQNLHGNFEDYLREMEKSKKLLNDAIDFANNAINDSKLKIPSTDSDLFLVKGEAYFYKGIYFDSIVERKEKINSDQTVKKLAIDIAYESFEKAIDLNQKTIEIVNSGKSQIIAAHENLEITAICLIYMSHIQFLKNNFDKGVKLISKYLAIETDVHSPWIKELYETNINSFMLLSVNQVEIDSNFNPNRKLMNIYRDHLLKILSHKFDSDTEMAERLKRHKSSISRSLNRKR